LDEDPVYADALGGDFQLVVAAGFDKKLHPLIHLCILHAALK
jgi:hypothetical protein